MPGGHRCIACNKAGHRVETCKTKAAGEIRRLRKLVGVKGGRGVAEKKPRARLRKGKTYRAAASKLYTKQQVEATADEKRGGLRKRSRAEVLETRQSVSSPQLAHDKLAQTGFCRILIKFGHSRASRPRVLNSFGHWCVSTYGAGWTWCLVVVVVVATGSFTQEPHDIVVANACACLGLLELGADSA